MMIKYINIEIEDNLSFNLSIYTNIISTFLLNINTFLNSKWIKHAKSVNIWRKILRYRLNKDNFKLFNLCDSS